MVIEPNSSDERDTNCSANGHGRPKRCRPCRYFLIEFYPVALRLPAPFFALQCSAEELKFDTYSRGITHPVDPLKRTAASCGKARR